MTKQASFKQRVRDRMAKTGESFTIARRQVELQSLKDDPLDATYALGSIGSKLTVEEAEGLERLLEQDPTYLPARIKLLGFYYLRWEQEAVRHRHVMWLIENEPGSAIAGIPYGQLRAYRDRSAYEEGRRAWARQIESGDAATLANAGNQLAEHGDAAGLELLARAYALLPDDHTLGRNFGFLLALLERPVESLQVYETVLGRDPDRLGTLPAAARVALAAGDVTKTERYAHELLALGPTDPEHWSYGEAINVAHDLLGQLALSRGDIAEAKRSLHEAGKAPRSNQSEIFGPSFALAQQLVERGEAAAVVDYLEECKRLWPNGADQLAEWQRALQAGDRPELYPNRRRTTSAGRNE